MITRDQAIAFTGYERVHYTGTLYRGSIPQGAARCAYENGKGGSRGRVGQGNGPYEFRVNGATKTWKSKARAQDFRVPIKHGLREYGYLDQNNAADFHLASDCPDRAEA